jgi:hypothetical protein
LIKDGETRSLALRKYQENKKKFSEVFSISLVFGWIKKGGATPDRSRTPARGPFFGANVLFFGI